MVRCLEYAKMPCLFTASRRRHLERCDNGCYRIKLCPCELAGMSSFTRYFTNMTSIEFISMNSNQNAPPSIIVCTKSYSCVSIVLRGSNTYPCLNHTFNNCSRRLIDCCVALSNCSGKNNNYSGAVNNYCSSRLANWSITVLVTAA